MIGIDLPLIFCIKDFFVRFLVHPANSGVNREMVVFGVEIVEVISIGAGEKIVGLGECGDKDVE